IDQDDDYENESSTSGKDQASRGHDSHGGPSYDGSRGRNGHDESRG
ncbi:7289_t:CDS:2, partial [Funneliformis geosporum]